MGQLDEDEFDVTADESGVEVEQVNEAGADGVEVETTETTAEGAEAGGEPVKTPEQLAAEKAAAEKAEAAAKAKAETEHAVNEFMAATEAAVTDEGVDPSTGTIPAGLVANVTTAYSKIPGRARKAAKDYLTEKMQDCMTKGVEDRALFMRARSYLDLLKAVQSLVQPKSDIIKTPTNPTEALLQRVVPALLAAHLIIPDEGVASDWTDQANAKAGALADQVKTYRQYLIDNKDKVGDERAAEPEVDPLVIAAAKMAAGKASTVRKAKAPKGDGTSTPRVSSGERREVAKHIYEYFADKPVDHWASIAEIAGFDSVEYGSGADHPSSGAVTARLFPKSGKCTLDGVVPDVRDKKGARKVA